MSDDKGMYKKITGFGWTPSERPICGTLCTLSSEQDTEGQKRLENGLVVAKFDDAITDVLKLPGAVKEFLNKEAWRAFFVPVRPIFNSWRVLTLQKPA